MGGQEIEMANKYKVFNAGGREELFFAYEETDCCTRQCQVRGCADCAPYSVTIMYTRGGSSQKVLELNKPSTCTVCCFNRPVLNVIDVGSGQQIGSIIDPCHLCNDDFTVRDSNGNGVL